MEEQGASRDSCSAASITADRRFGGLSRRPIPAADAGDVMHDQLDDLLQHVELAPCGCADCGRYLAVSALLLTTFRSPLARRDNRDH